MAENATKNVAKNPAENVIPDNPALQKLKEIIAKVSEREVSSVVDDAVLGKDLGMDVWDLNEVILEFEKAFNISVSENFMDQTCTVKEVWSVVSKHLDGADKKKMREIIAEASGHDVQSIADNMVLGKDLGLDSLDIFYLIYDSQETYDIKFPENEAYQFVDQNHTVKDVWIFISKYIEEKNNAVATDKNKNVRV